MKKRLITVVVIILALIALVAALKIYQFNPVNEPINEEEKIAVNEPDSAAQIANPASANCLKLGGNLVIQKRGDGGEYGLCYFEDNRACEEWALLRGDCPYGGRKTTGFDTIDQEYCVWLGGETSVGLQSVCIFKDGSECSTEEFYNGKCPFR